MKVQTNVRAGGSKIKSPSYSKPSYSAPSYAGRCVGFYSAPIYSRCTGY